MERLGGEEWEGLARPTRRLHAGRRYGPVELLEHLGEGRWRLRLDGEPDGEAPLPPYITEPLDDPDRYQTVYAAARARRRRRRRGSTSRPSCSAAARRRAGDAARRARHLPAAHRRTLEDHPLHGERYEVAPRGVGADPRGAARARRGDDDGAACSRRSPAARRSPGARRSSSRPASSSGASTAADELPPAALDAARARDGVRRRRARRGAVPRRRGGALPLLLVRRRDAGHLIVEELERQVEGRTCGTHLRSLLPLGPRRSGGFEAAGRGARPGSRCRRCPARRTGRVESSRDARRARRRPARPLLRRDRAPSPRRPIGRRGGGTGPTTPWSSARPSR